MQSHKVSKNKKAKDKTRNVKKRINKNRSIDLFLIEPYNLLVQNRSLRTPPIIVLACISFPRTN